MSYSTEITNAMTWLGQQPDTLFLGQGVRFPGHGMFSTLSGVPDDKKIELPVAEDMQMGMSIGLALTGKTVISVYPRFDFLLCAVNQLVNHLDKLEEFTHGEYNAKVIIRVGIGSTTPMNPGVQHSGDYTDAFREMLKMPVVLCNVPEEVQLIYGLAYNYHGCTLIVEDMSLYA
jgi:pyruvate/2-oxoglutarate/acetoin dehydrogenase E1 component